VTVFDFDCLATFVEFLARIARRDVSVWACKWLSQLCGRRQRGVMERQRRLFELGDDNNGAGHGYLNRQCLRQPKESLPANLAPWLETFLVSQLTN